MFKQLLQVRRQSERSGKRNIASSLTATVLWLAIYSFWLPIQAQSNYEGLGRRGTRIWGERACNINGLTSQEKITEFLDYCAPKYTPEEQAYVDMKAQAAIGLLFSFFFDLGIFQRPSPSVVRRVTDYIDEGVSTSGTYRGNNGTRAIVVQRRNGQIAIRDINTGETRIVDSRTGQLVDDIDEAIANRNTRGSRNSRRTLENPCLSLSSNKILIASINLEALATEVCPEYIRDNRYPAVRETFLADGSIYKKIHQRVRGNIPVFRDADGNYYYIDRFHTGRKAHIEVFDRNKNHLGTMTPEGIMIPNSQVPSRTLEF